MKYLLIALVVGLMGCTEKQKCDLATKSMDLLVPGIVVGLECSNAAAIKASLVEVAEKAGLCKPTDVSALGLGADACKLLGVAVVELAAGNAIPAAWGCKAENAKDKLKEVIQQQCSKLEVQASPV